MHVYSNQHYFSFGWSVILLLLLLSLPLSSYCRWIRFVKYNDKVEMSFGESINKIRCATCHILSHWTCICTFLKAPKLRNDFLLFILSSYFFACLLSSVNIQINDKNSYIWHISAARNVCAFSKLMCVCVCVRELRILRQISRNACLLIERMSKQTAYKYVCVYRKVYGNVWKLKIYVSQTMLVSERASEWKRTNTHIHTYAYITIYKV